MQEKSENFNSLRPILFELCKKNYRGVKLPPPPAGIGFNTHHYSQSSSQSLQKIVGLPLKVFGKDKVRGKLSSSFPLDGERFTNLQIYSFLSFTPSAFKLKFGEFYANIQLSNTEGGSQRLFCFSWEHIPPTSYILPPTSYLLVLT